MPHVAVDKLLAALQHIQDHMISITQSLAIVSGVLDTTQEVIVRQTAYEESYKTRTARMMILCRELETLCTTVAHIDEQRATKIEQLCSAMRRELTETQLVLQPIGEADDQSHGDRAC